MEKQDIVVLDKDLTLIDHHFTYFRGATEFVAAQKMAGRSPVVATTAGCRSQNQLRSFQIDDFFSRENVYGGNYYHDAADTLAPIERDFHRKGGLEYLGELLGKCWRERRVSNGTNGNPEPEVFFSESGYCGIDRLKPPFDVSRRYKNPRAVDGPFGKDMHIVRTLLETRRKIEARMAFVGDTQDMVNVDSDPRTPFIIVPNDGGWLVRKKVNALLDTFLGAADVSPAEIFDALIAGGKPRPLDMGISTVRQAVAAVGEGFYHFAKTPRGGRMVFESKVYKIFPL